MSLDMRANCLECKSCDEKAYKSGKPYCTYPGTRHIANGECEQKRLDATVKHWVVSDKAGCRGGVITRGGTIIQAGSMFYALIGKQLDELDTARYTYQHYINKH